MAESGEALVPSIVRLFVNRKQLLIITRVSKIVGAKSSIPILLYQVGLLRGRCQTRIISAKDSLAKTPIRRKGKETGRG